MLAFKLGYSLKLLLIKDLLSTESNRSSLISKPSSLKLVLEKPNNPMNSDPVFVASQLSVHKLQAGIPPNLLEKWQESVNLLAEFAPGCIARLLQFDPPGWKVIVASRSDLNPYCSGQQFKIGAGLYSETVLDTGSELLVSNRSQAQTLNAQADLQQGWLSYFGFPLLWPDGVPFGTLGLLSSKENAFSPLQRRLLKQFQKAINSDLLALRQTEQLKLLENTKERLWQSEERYRQMFQKSRAIKLLINPQTGAIVDANLAACDFYGYSLKELQALKTSDLNILSEEELQQEMAQALKEEHNHFLFRHRLASGEVRSVEVHSSPLNIGGHQLLYSIIHDITGRRQVEKALQDEHSFALQVMNTMGQGLMVTNSEGRIEFINPAYAQLLGYSQEELIGKPLMDMALDDDRKVLEEVRKRRLAGESSTYDSRIMRRDGTLIYVSVTGVPRWRDGKVVGNIAVITDMTERRRIEEAQRRQTEYLTALHETTLALMNRLELTDLLEAIVTRAGGLVGTPHGYIYLLEPGEKEMAVKIGVGYHSGRTFSKVTPGEGMVGRVWQSGQPLVIDDYTTWSHRLPDAEHDPIHAVVELPLKSGSKVIGVLGLASMEAGRTFGEEQVELLNRFAQLASIALDNAQLYTSAQRHLSELTTVQRIAQAINSSLKLDEIFHTVVNQVSEAFGYELIAIYLRSGDGLLLQAWVGYEDNIFYIPLSQGVCGRVARTGKAVFTRDVSQEPDFLFAVKPIQQSIITPFKSGKGEVLGTLVVESRGHPVLTEDDYKLLTLLSDQISVAVENARLFEERLTLERKLQETQKLESLGVLAGGIAHDFNNLLVGVMGNAGLALLELPDDSPVRETIEQIEVAAQRAADLTRQMLAYSGKGRFIIQHLDLGKLVQEMSQLLKVSISKNTIVSYEFESNLPKVEADATQLRQVIMNLLINASEAVGEREGHINLSTGVRWVDRKYLASTYLAPDLPEGKYVYLEVTDNGSGMDSETLGKIFDPFFTTKFTGRGLGLAAVLGIVRGHKGALKVTSQPGQGTTFSILLPAVPD